MNKFVSMLMAAVLAFGVSGCSSYSPDAGHEVVLVEKPMFFGHGGVNSDPIKAGRTYGAITTDGIDVNMQPQRVDMEFDDMMTKSGVPVSFHVLFTFKVTDSVALVKGYGVDSNSEAKTAWAKNMDAQINQLVRDSVKAYDMQDIAVSQIAVDAVTAKITQGAFNIAKNTGMPIQLISVNVGRILPPDAIKNQRIETAAQEQRVITMQQTKLAEDARKDAEASRAAADNAYRQEMQLSPEQFIQLENIKMLKEVCSHTQNCTFINGNATPLVNVK